MSLSPLNQEARCDVILYFPSSYEMKSKLGRLDKS